MPLIEEFKQCPFCRGTGKTPSVDDMTTIGSEFRTYIEVINECKECFGKGKTLYQTLT